MPSSNATSRFVPYAEASAWYRAEGVTSSAQLRARVKQGLPPGIPSSPLRAYPQEFQDGGLGRFLGTDRVATRNRAFVPYTEASAWYRAEGVASFRQLEARAKKGLPPGIPSSPHQAYPQEFQDGGLGRFLGTARVANKNRVFVPYAEASAWYRAEGVSSWVELRARAKQGLPPGIPSNVRQAYPQEFQDGGLGRFLGTARVANKNRVFVPYEEASTWYRAEGVTSLEQLRARAKKGLPSGIPSAPDSAYHDFNARGGLTVFLGLKKMAGASKAERTLRHVLETLFDDASPHLGCLRVAGESGQKWQVDILLPGPRLVVEYDGSQFHYKPENEGRDRRKTADLVAAGWRVVRLRGQSRTHSLPLLCQEWDGMVDETLPVADRVAQTIAHLRSLESKGLLSLPLIVSERLQAWRQEDLNLKNIRNVLVAYDGLKSYDEAAAWYRAEGVTSFAQLRARAKQGLPPGIPANPLRAYPQEFQDGGLGRFLGTGRVASQNRVFVPYAEASAWYRAEGVASSRQLQARAKQGLPPGIPSSPRQAYPQEFQNGGLRRFLAPPELFETLSQESHHDSTGCD